MLPVWSRRSIAVQAINVEEEGDSSSIDAWPLEDMRAVGITAGSGKASWAVCMELCWMAKAD